MKSDLDALMQNRNLDALLVVGNAEHNPPMYYLTGGGHVSHATVIKKRGEEAAYFHNDMERDEAAKSGLRLIPYSKYDYDALYKEADGDLLLASALRYRMMFEELGLTRGRVGVYGFYDLSAVFGTLSRLQKLLPELEFVGEPREDSIFMRAMETKDAAEVERIRRMGRITTTVVGKTRDYLTEREVRADEVLLKEDGSPLTVGDVHAKIRLWVAEQGAELPSGFIFAIGRDAGVPHSTGNPADLMRLGQTIVFDIYPAEAGGGYYYDFTRTWSLGYAAPEAQELYNQVKEIFDKLMDNFDVNAPFKHYHKMTCEYFESKGHQSPLNTKAPVEGYVHSLGHLQRRPATRPGRGHHLRAGTVLSRKGHGFPHRRHALGAPRRDD
ncbi:M24 family metallopeptidase [Anaerolineae bacterium AMX1]|nr:M24 family metallopeptidase [Anaerolineae bacterium AMX1]